MQYTVLFLIGLVLLGVFVTVRARPVIRVATMLIVCSVCAFEAVQLGMSMERFAVRSGHLHYLGEYSRHVRRLAEEGRFRELADVVVCFDDGIRRVGLSDERVVEEAFREVMSLTASPTRESDDGTGRQ